MPQLEKLKDPALETLNQIFVYMDSLSNNILKRVFVRFPQVLDEISEISSQVLQDQRDKTRVVVENIIDSELGYIFTNDPEYLTSNVSLVPQ
jgi:vacuolar protein sorting-associated protein 1